MPLETPRSNIAAAPPAPKRTPEELEAQRKRELLKKVRVLRDNMLVNRGAVLEGDQNKEYCWVNIREDRQVFFQSLGWSVCVDPKVKTRWKQPDGTHKRGDVILYEIDKEMFEAMQFDSVARGIEALEGVDTAFSENIGNLGARAIKPQI